MEIALTYIYGIGRTSAKKILLEAEVSGDTKSDNLTDVELTRIRTVIDSHYKVEGDLRREISMNIKRLMDIGSYGVYGIENPCRFGGNVAYNARTRKGPRRSVVGKRKKA